MENIIEKLYDLHVSMESFPFGVPNKEHSDEEWRTYQFLYENLTGEQKKKFLANRDRIEPASKQSFPHLLSNAFLWYLYTTAPTFAKIYRKIPALRCFAIFYEQILDKTRQNRRATTAVYRGF